MSAPDAFMSRSRAEAVLGLAAPADPAELRRAFRTAVKAAHPDRGGDPVRFREVVAAYELLNSPARPDRVATPWPRPRSGRRPVLEISLQVALCGGEATHPLPDGRRLRVKLPPGLRFGDSVKAAGQEWKIVVLAEGDVHVRGDDLWTSAAIPASMQIQGGRLPLETPRGRRVVWVSPKAAAEGLLRVPGEGLPARSGRRQGDLVVRLFCAAASGPVGAQTMRERFTTAWTA